MKIIGNLNKKFKKIFFYYKYNFFRRIRILFKINQKIIINEQELILPPEHLLSIHHYVYPKYDKFISSLVINLKENESVIDIGANIGDTLARLINSNSKLLYYSIEADEYFFKYLKKNKKKMQSNTENKITIIKELVGMDLIGNLENTTPGTKSLTESNDGLKTKKLDEIITEHNIKNIALIKVDVDGYDYNVLLSGMNQIRKHKPILFFEYMSLNKFGHINLVNRLNEVGYKNWTVLNNYGEIIFENKNYADVLNLIRSGKKNKVYVDIYCKWEC
jgi:FkbM family methyltransferase